jgi:hypothetical protein
MSEADAVVLERLSTADEPLDEGERTVQIVAGAPRLVAQQWLDARRPSSSRS